MSIPDDDIDSLVADIDDLISMTLHHNATLTQMLNKCAEGSTAAPMILSTIAGNTAFIQNLEDQCAGLVSPPSATT